MNITDQVIKYETLKQTLTSIPNEEHRIFLKTVYATLGRVGEIVRGRYKENPPIKSSQITHTKNLMFITLKTEKTQKARKVPCARIDDNTQVFLKKNEAWLTEDIINYAKKNGGVLWDKSTRWGQYIFRDYFPEYNNHIHLLRHWRATHLLSGNATGVPVPERVVAKMGGWVGTKTLTATYDNTIVEDYVKVIE